MANAQALFTSSTSCNTRCRTRKACPGPRSHAVTLYDHHADIIPYDSASIWQKQRAKSVASCSIDGISNSESVTSQALLILQHPPIYTLGTRSSLENLKFSPSNAPFPLYQTERGGEATYHGPGQLVLYPIMDLRRTEKDLHAYMRRLEEVAIRALGLVSAIHAYRVTGRTGMTHGVDQYSFLQN